ncbi:MAG: helix-turn-helix domain-containing protein [Sphingorhabdus sp.]|uniref:helix-turn-helix domain-containing protein n=1 Tax=Sphingorhabdus sp. TaxID=1902408 RepID=UPI0038FC56A8
MTSFQIAISPSRRAAGRFISRVRRSLQRALVEENELTGANQSGVAAAIGVHRSVISRELNGRQDITLGRIAEIAWALGREIEFELVRPEQRHGCNIALSTSGIITDEQNRLNSIEASSTVKIEQILEVQM